MAQLLTILGEKRESAVLLLKCIERQLNNQFINKINGLEVKEKSIIQNLMQLSE